MERVSLHHHPQTPHYTLMSYKLTLQPLPLSTYQPNYDHSVYSLTGHAYQWHLFRLSSLPSSNRLMVRKAVTSDAMFPPHLPFLHPLSPLAPFHARFLVHWPLYLLAYSFIKPNWLWHNTVPFTVIAMGSLSAEIDHSYPNECKGYHSITLQRVERQLWQPHVIKGPFGPLFKSEWTNRGVRPYIHMIRHQMLHTCLSENNSTPKDSSSCSFADLYEMACCVLTNRVDQGSRYSLLCSDTDTSSSRSSLTHHCKARAMEILYHKSISDPHVPFSSIMVYLSW